MADFGATELETFRSEVRDWLAAHFPKSLAHDADAQLAKQRSELMIEAMGGQGLGWEGEGFASDEVAAVRGWLRTKANSIEGGTSEINLNVVAKRVLGLPDPK